MHTLIRCEKRKRKGVSNMIYNKPNEIIRVSRTGRQYENTCIGCINLINTSDIVDRTQAHQCNKYPAMDNFVRCMNYKESKVINTIQTVMT